MAMPKEIGKGGDRILRVVWDDGKECLYPFRLLAMACPCANCRKRREDAGKPKAHPLQLKLADPDAPPEDPILEKVDWVGNYALRFTWERGCEHGIYPFEYLRDLCGKKEEDLF